MPAMHRSHFELIAETIQELERDAIVSPEQRERIAEAFGRELRRTNGGFRSERFLRACVPGANVRART